MSPKSEETWMYNIEILLLEQSTKDTLSFMPEVNWPTDGHAMDRTAPWHHYHGAEAGGLGREKRAGSAFM